MAKKKKSQAKANAKKKAARPNVKQAAKKPPKKAAPSKGRSARPVGVNARKAVRANGAKTRPAAPRPPRRSWLDDEANAPLIDTYARRLEHFVQALADNKVDEDEVRNQEARLVKLMKQIEPELNDAQHGKITELLCELTAYDLMRLLYAMEQARPTTAFRG